MSVIARFAVPERRNGHPILLVLLCYKILNQLEFRAEGRYPV